MSAQLSPGSLMPFETEAEAVDYVVACLRPFCKSIKREPEFTNGLRPDLGVRFSALPDMPICIEVKKFWAGKITPLPEAIAQASSYAELTGNAAFVAPLIGSGMMKFSWNCSDIGSALLVAGQFNVGALYFHPKREGHGGLLLAGVAVAQFSLDAYGDPHTRLHDQARHLLKTKQRSGSQAWRS